MLTIRRRQKISRERERYLVDAVKTLATALDDFEGIDVTLADFDLANADCVSDDDPDEVEIEQDSNEEDT